jgi:8-oxo-dGTP pyrophosphatase MutT (NUDIX family)
MIKPWRLLRSRMLLNDPWIKLRSDVCERQDGLQIEPFYVIEPPEWVCVLPITQDQRVVLTKEYRHGARVVGIGLPGGLVEPGDADPSHAAKRELLEETGFRSDEFVSVGARYANWANHTNRVHYFVARNVTRLQAQELDRNEQIEVLLAPLLQVIDPEFLQQSFHLACVQLALPHLRDLVDSVP